MWKRYRFCNQVRIEVEAWASAHGYARDQIQFVYPWLEKSLDTAKAVVVLFRYEPNAVPGYQTIFSTYSVTVLERTLPEDINVFHPLSPKTKQLILECVRSAATAVVYGTEFERREYFETSLPDTLLAATNQIDVVTWCGGSVRGSRISQGESLLDALITYAQHSVRDERYKPITPEELSRTQFEVLVASDMWLPVGSEDTAQSNLVHDHVVRVRDRASVRGYYFPTIYNMDEDPRPAALLNTLARNKAGMPDTEQAYFDTARVIGLVEDIVENQVLVTDGVTSEHSSDTLPAYRDWLDESLAAILRAVDADGYVQNIHSPQGTRPYRVDLVRQAFLYAALQEYRQASKDDRFDDQITAIRAFIMAHLPLVRKPRDATPVYMYLLQGDCFDKRGLATPAGEHFLTLPIETPQTEGRIILHLQHLKALYYFGLEADQSGSSVRAATMALFTRWQTMKETASPIIFADLYALLRWQSCAREAKEYETWLRTLVRSDGSVPARPGLVKTYARGVSKVAETSAYFNDTHDIAVENLRWLERMRYTPQRMYHIEEGRRAQLAGGLRHDNWDRAVWVDGLAHLLITLTRLEYPAAHTSHLQTYSLA